MATAVARTEFGVVGISDKGGARLRADAQRSRDRIVRAASEVFIRDGANASLEAIARQAGVGSATLYRHFGSRWMLLEAVFADGVQALCERVELHARDADPREALLQWLQAVCAYCTATRGLAAALLQSDAQQGRASAGGCHQILANAGTPLLRRAQTARAVRAGVTITDLLNLVSAIALASEQSSAESRRLLTLAFNGIAPS